jgi:hypothetical protein
MAKKRSKKTPVKRAASRVPAKVATSAPVTLDEARVLARSSAPTRSIRRAARPAAGASPATVGAERERLAAKRREEARDRIDEYRATLTIMKRHGAREPGPRRARGLGPRTIAAPLQILAEGDSWFDYPFPLFGGGIIPRLSSLLGVPILNLAKAGDEVRYMLGVEERTEIIEQLTQGCPAGGQWEALLFSGGGNDIVDNPMALWIRDFDASIPVERHIHQPRFDSALALVRAGYEDLIALRDQLSPDTHLFFHAYDFAIPDGRGACHLGPWLKPTFDLRKFKSRAAASAVVREMLGQFAVMLADLAAAHPRITLINGQGLLPAKTASWHNELHPAKQGFKQFAQLFHDSLKAVFPDRVF